MNLGSTVDGGSQQPHSFAFSSLQLARPTCNTVSQASMVAAALDLRPVQAPLRGPGTYQSAAARSTFTTEAPASPVFDLDIPDEAGGGRCCSPSDSSQHSKAVLRAQSEALSAPQSSFQKRLLADMRFFKEATLQEEGRCDTVVLATKLVSVGYRVSIRTALGGGVGQECFQHLNHTFLLVSSAAGGQPCIADPHFRSSFGLSDLHATSQYAAALPSSEEFVGSEARITQLVDFLCTEMAVAFRAAGRSPPPWRSPRSMLSKWLPTRSKDVVVRPAISPASEAVAIRSSAQTAQLASCSPAANTGTDAKGAPDAGSSCSPTSPLDMTMSPSDLASGLQRTSPKPPSAVQQPANVQTGFSVTSGTSLLSRQLGAAAVNGSSPPLPHQNRPQSCSPFDMWSGQPLLRQQGLAAQRQDQHRDMPAIRTVKMTGRCR